MVYIATGQPTPWKDPERLPDNEPAPHILGFGYQTPEPEKPKPRVKIPKVITVDFETFGIEGRPDYPPRPVGVSIKKYRKKAKYYSWGHVSGGNNCTEEGARLALMEVWNNPDGLLFHNAKFDLDVAEVHMNLTPPPWERVHETMFLLFLDNPHARELGLKPSAKRLLGMEPEERDAVADWLVEQQPVEGVRITRGAGKSKNGAGKYIAYAPGNVVGDYANGDTIRTEALFVHLYADIVNRGMLPAYERERKLIPILMGMEREGIRVDVDRLKADVVMYNTLLHDLDKWLRKKLGCGSDVNLDSGQQLVRALDEAGIADTSLMGVTKTGLIKSDKAAIAAGVTDKQVAAVLQYTTQLQTCVNTFMMPWLETALKSGGLIFTNWNQTRGSNGGGARTGRFSSSPNFQNIPKEFAQIFFDAEVNQKAELYLKTLPKGQKREDQLKEVRRLKNIPKHPFRMPPLPLCRGYIIPHKPGHALVGRDYSQQEPRILAHFEGGVLMEQYQSNPWIDYHDNARDHLQRIFNRLFQRKHVKNINLGIIYGQGVGSLAMKNGESVADTKALKEAIYAMYPGLKEMYSEMKRRAKAKEPIRTWGSREYYCEPPIWIDGKMITFDYKMVNVLVQGSAADCTKEGMIRFADLLQKRYHNRGWLMILQVHDEIILSVPAEDTEEAQEALRACMESVEFDVQILSEGSYSNDNWSSMRDFDKKGKRV